MCGKASVVEIHNAKINTAGAYVSVNGAYLFAVGDKPYQGRIPVVRLGGHREVKETGWQCAMREVYEETGCQITPLSPSKTYLLSDGDNLDTEFEIIKWEHAEEPAPLLIVAYFRAGETLLSLMYLAQTANSPTPSTEIKGLLLLKKEEIHRLCEEPTTLKQYLASGGQAILNYNFDQSLFLEPFMQLRLLSRILLIESER